MKCFLSAVDEQNEKTSQAISQCAAASFLNNHKAKKDTSILHVLDDLPESMVDNEDEESQSDIKLELLEEGECVEESADRVNFNLSNVSSQDEVDIMMTKTIEKQNQEISEVCDGKSSGAYFLLVCEMFIKCLHQK